MLDNGSGERLVQDSAGVVTMETKPSREFTDSCILFRSVDRNLADNYMEFWEAAAGEFFQYYREAENDGTEDGLRCRMIAAIRLAQFGLNMFNFFSSCAVAINNSKADTEACNATAKVVSLMIERKVDGWITVAKRGQN